MSFKMQSNILEVTNEFKKYAAIINEIDATSDDFTLSNYEIAQKHLILIEDQSNLSFNIMRNLPFWSEFSNFQCEQINESLPTPSFFSEPVSVNKTLIEIRSAKNNECTTSICPDLESLDSQETPFFELNDNLLSDQNDDLTSQIISYDPNSKYVPIRSAHKKRRLELLESSFDMSLLEMKRSVKKSRLNLSDSDDE